MRIRLATADDLDQITQLFQNTVQLINSKDYSPAQIKVWSAGAQSTEGWLSRIRDQYFIVAQEAQNIVGFASLASDGYLDLMYIHHAHQGKGIGSALIEHLFSYAETKRIPLLASDVSITARTFFEKHGFEVVREQSVDIRGVSLTNYRMQKSLK